MKFYLIFLSSIALTATTVNAQSYAYSVEECTQACQKASAARSICNRGGGTLPQNFPGCLQCQPDDEGDEDRMNHFVTPGLKCGSADCPPEVRERYYDQLKDGFVVCGMNFHVADLQSISRDTFFNTGTATAATTEPTETDTTATTVIDTAVTTTTTTLESSSETIETSAQNSTIVETSTIESSSSSASSEESVTTETSTVPESSSDDSSETKASTSTESTAETTTTTTTTAPTTAVTTTTVEQGNGSNNNLVPSSILLIALFSMIFI